MERRPLNRLSLLAHPLPLALFALACGTTDGGEPFDNSGGAPSSGGQGGPASGGQTGGTAAGGAGGSPSIGGSTGGSSGGQPAVSGGAPNTGGVQHPAGGTPADGGGGSAGSGGTSSTGGESGGESGGSGGMLVLGPSSGSCTVGAGQQSGEGNTQERYLDAEVQRDGDNYMMITNGWGMGWVSHDISWKGTTLAVNAFEGSRQSNGAPAGYPSVFCGRYSNKESGECGLPATRSAIGALHTAAAWSHTEENGVYNVAYDVWMGSASGGGLGGGLQSYFMVWLHDPPEEGPAGSLREEGVTVDGVEGVWNIVDGTVNGLPIVNYVRAEGDDAHEIAFDLLDFMSDAESRNLNFPGSDVLAVAIGFEIWQGPVSGLNLDDFCVSVE